MGLKRKYFLIICLFIFFAISLSLAFQTPPPPSMTSPPSAGCPPTLRPGSVSPYYACRTPIAYDIGAQPLTVYGDLSSLL
jgi:hypothetical protein